MKHNTMQSLTAAGSGHEVFAKGHIAAGSQQRSILVERVRHETSQAYTRTFGRAASCCG